MDTANHTTDNQRLLLVCVRALNYADDDVLIATG